MPSNHPTLGENSLRISQPTIMFMTSADLGKESSLPDRTFIEKLNLQHYHQDPARRPIGSLSMVPSTHDRSCLCLTYEQPTLPEH